MDTSYDNNVVAGALNPLVASFDQSALESSIAFRVDDQTQRRFDELAEKASDGTLTSNERRAYESMIGTSAIVAVLQAQAEKRPSSSSPNRA